MAMTFTAPPALAPLSSKRVPERDLEQAFTNELSSPDSFDTSDFRLAVHAVNPVMAERFREWRHLSGTYDAKRDVDLLKNPLDRQRARGAFPGDSTRSRRRWPFAPADERFLSCSYRRAYYSAVWNAVVSVGFVLARWRLRYPAVASSSVNSAVLVKLRVDLQVKS